MWKGSISFGLVTIPVKLYAATEARDLRFNLLHEECRTPVQYRKWCPSCDREIMQEEIVKGFEYERGRYVILAEEDFESIPLAAAHTLEIVDFVRLEQIDPVYYDRTYYLEPGEGGARAYALLRKAMEESGRIAIARVVIRTRESLAAIRVFQGGVLALETMHFPEEIRSPAGLTGIAEPELRPQELEMAIGLVTSLSGEFEPEKFENRYRQALLTLIEAKVTGEEVVPVEEAPPRGKVVDLMAALQASIRQAEAAREGQGEAAGAGAAAGGLPPGVGVAGAAAAAGWPPPGTPATGRPSPGLRTAGPAAGVPAPPGIPAAGRAGAPVPIPGAPSPSAASVPAAAPPNDPGVPPAVPFSPPPSPDAEVPGITPDR